MDRHKRKASQACLPCSLGRQGSALPPVVVLTPETSSIPSSPSLPSPSLSTRHHGQAFRHRCPLRGSRLDRVGAAGWHADYGDAPEVDVEAVLGRGLLHDQERRGHHRFQLAMGARQERLHQLLYGQYVEHHHLQGRQDVCERLRRRRRRVPQHLRRHDQRRCPHAAVRHEGRVL